MHFLKYGNVEDVQRQHATKYDIEEEELKMCAEVVAENLYTSEEAIATKDDYVKSTTDQLWLYH